MSVPVVDDDDDGDDKLNFLHLRVWARCRRGGRATVRLRMNSLKMKLLMERGMTLGEGPTDNTCLLVALSMRRSGVIQIVVGVVSSLW